MLLSLFNNFIGPDTVSIRALLAFFISLVICLLCGTKFINFMKVKQGKGQPIREDGPQSHLLTKKGTPTMGGLMILASAILSTLFFANLGNQFIWISIVVLLVYGFVGFIDDYVKVTKQTSNAMTARMKLLLQFSTALIAVIVISQGSPENVRYNLNFPYFRNLALNLFWFYIPFAMIVITGTSNAVNLSDGLDGLSTGLLIVSFSAFLIIAAICGLPDTSLNITSIPQSAEITVLCASIIGACLGFLWFNASPAKIFMGDTGSLALGALLGTIAVMLKSEVLLAIIGGVFVIEAISVMMQVFWYKRTKKRIFLMAPIHHHFEQKGWSEVAVVTRFWIVAIILAILGILSLFTPTLF
ncbi:MAG: phospho-N-acetylmuramoyl-pentapeptide-transferase [Lactobacillus sp.]|jgi:phospho-N-acetylmuramoyl-pentapeptide-transferase|nr:phospho-N-acetylmuramoyl-pentapeptide-transferase [Lactobacillus sp.]